MKRKLPKIDAQCIKIAIAVLICLAAFELIQLDNAFYAAIAAVICLKPTMEGSAKAGKNRIIGTMIGGGAGFLAAFLFETIGYRFTTILIPVFILGVIYLCVLLHMRDSFTIACVVILSVLIMHKPEGMNVYVYIITRILETVFGVLVAMGINFAGFLIQRRREKSGPEKEARMEVLLIEYPKCSTCKKAKAWLVAHGIEFRDRHIVEQPPTAAEILEWQERGKIPLKRFFNTSGMVYREGGLKEKLPAMSEQEQREMLAGNGMLVKRPILVTQDRVLLGFREKEWESAFGEDMEDGE